MSENRERAQPIDNVQFAALGQSSPVASLLAEGSMKHFYKGLKQALQLWSEDNLPGPVPETWTQFQARVERARLGIQRTGGKRVLVVALKFADGPDEVHLQSIARMETKARPYEPGDENPYLTPAG